MTLYHLYYCVKHAALPFYKGKDDLYYRELYWKDPVDAKGFFGNISEFPNDGPRKGSYFKTVTAFRKATGQHSTDTIYHFLVVPSFKDGRFRVPR